MTGTGCHAMSHPNTQSTQDRHRLDHMLWRHKNITAHVGFIRKKLENRWRFLWSQPVNHSNCLGNYTIQQLPPGPQSRFLSPPAPLTSSCHYMFFEILLMKKNESSLPANTGLNLFQAKSIRFCQSSGDRAPPVLQLLPPHLLGNNASDSPLEKQVRDEVTQVLGGAAIGAWDPKYKLLVWTELKR